MRNLSWEVWPRLCLQPCLVAAWSSLKKVGGCKETLRDRDLMNAKSGSLPLESNIWEEKRAFPKLQLSFERTQWETVVKVPGRAAPVHRGSWLLGEPMCRASPNWLPKHMKEGTVGFSCHQESVKLSLPVSKGPCSDSRQTPVWRGPRCKGFINRWLD